MALGLPIAVLVGGLASAVSVWWCLRSVEGRQIDLQRVATGGPEEIADLGPLPETVRLHIRDGVYFLVAHDRLTGVDWINIERVAEPSTNPALDARIIPAWAEMPETYRARDFDGVLPRVGTLAVGWPSRAIARQWVEPDETRGFIPMIENDDDGSSTAKAAARFFGDQRGSSVIVLWGGVATNALFFTLIAWPAVLLILSRRRGQTRGQTGGQTRGQMGRLGS
jgi:hypothetical protein